MRVLRNNMGRVKAREKMWKSNGRKLIILR